MAHKTLINGTAYEVSGGKTLVNGTGYNIVSGRTLIDGTGYDINFLLPPLLESVWSGGNSSLTTVTVIKYLNGYWIIGGACSEDYPSQYIRIAYAKSLNGPWTIKDLWMESSGGGGYQAYVTDIAYGNGYWVVTGSCYGGQTIGGMAYTTDLDGEWTVLADTPAPDGAGGISYIHYANGQWVYLTTTYGSSRTYVYAVSSTSLNGPWTYKPIISYVTNQNVPKGLMYANGYWVAVCQYSTDEVHVYYTTDPTASWTSLKIWSAADSDYAGYPHGLTYKNGYWVVWGYHKDSSTKSYACIAYATSPAGPWTLLDLWSGRPNQYIKSVDYADGKWVLTGRYYSYVNSSNATTYNRIGYAASLDGTWTYKDFTTYDVPAQIINADGYWATVMDTDATVYVMFASTVEELCDLV